MSLQIVDFPQNGPEPRDAILKRECRRQCLENDRDCIDPIDHEPLIDSESTRLLRTSDDLHCYNPEGLRTVYNQNPRNFQNPITREPLQPLPEWVRTRRSVYDEERERRGRRQRRREDARRITREQFENYFQYIYEHTGINNIETILGENNENLFGTRDTIRQSRLVELGLPIPHEAIEIYLNRIGQLQTPEIIRLFFEVYARQPQIAYLLHENFNIITAENMRDYPEEFRSALINLITLRAVNFIQ